MSHGKYARFKVILEEKFPFNLAYYTVAHKCRIALLGRRAVHCLEDEEGEGAQEAEMYCWARRYAPGSVVGTHSFNKSG